MKLIDLFAGCGGLTAGFAAAGFQPVMAVEWEKAAAATYTANFGGHVLREDITKLPDSVFPPADAVVGGPPCQGFSNLGTRDPADPRNRLWQEYARVVGLTRPSVFLLENVPQFLKSDQFRLLEHWTEKGPLEGYELTAGVLNAADYGVPQKRKRAFVVGSKNGRLPLPPMTHSQGGLPAAWSTVRDALSGLPYETGPVSLPDRRTLPDIPGPFKVAELHLSRRPSEVSLMRYDLVPPGGGRFDLPEELLPDCWKNKPTGTADVMGRMKWEEPSLTVRTEFFKPEKGRYLHPQWDPDDPQNRVNRPISHWEAARLQTFPDRFVWCGTKISIARQIGNAVPPLLAERLAEHMASAV